MVLSCGVRDALVARPVSSDIGTWLRQQLHDRYVVEETGWAPERVTQVAQRLQRDVDEER